MITDPPPSSSTTYIYIYIYIYLCDTWHLTSDKWHVTCNMWHMTCNIWHVPCDMWDMVGGKVFIEHPMLHQVNLTYYKGAFRKEKNLFFGYCQQRLQICLIEGKQTQTNTTITVSRALVHSLSCSVTSIRPWSVE